ETRFDAAGALDDGPDDLGGDLGGLESPGGSEAEPLARDLDRMEFNHPDGAEDHGAGRQRGRGARGDERSENADPEEQGAETDAHPQREIRGTDRAALSR